MFLIGSQHSNDGATSSLLDVGPWLRQRCIELKTAVELAKAEMAEPCNVGVLNDWFPPWWWHGLTQHQAEKLRIKVLITMVIVRIRHGAVENWFVIVNHGQ